jgi:hypothetical protein
MPSNENILSRNIAIKEAKSYNWFMETIVKYIDQITLGTALFISVFVSVKTWRQSGKRTRLGVLPFLFLAPVLITTSMFTHVLEVTYHVIETRLTGRFSYSFYLYSLYLLPLVLGYLSINYYRQTRLFCLSQAVNKVTLLKTAGLISLISLPAAKIVPIAALPTVISIISLLASLFVFKKRQENMDIEKEKAQRRATVSA